MKKKLLEVIEILKRIRKNPPKKWTRKEVEAISFSFDWLLEEAEKK